MFKQASLVSILTLLSRILGYIRDAFVAAFLGAGLLNDIYVVAIRIPNLFRSLFGEGAMNAAFVPIFAKKLDKSKAEAKKFIAQVNAILFFIALAITVLMVALMPYILTVLAPGFVENKEAFDIAVYLSRITSLYFLFVVMSALYGGAMNSLNKFFVFACAHALFNVAMIVMMIFIDVGETKAHNLSYIFTISGLIELLWCVSFAYKFGFLKFATKIKINDDIKSLFRRLLPGIVGSGIMQINTWVSTILASFFMGGVSYLYYADRIYQLPLALIGTAMGTVLLPTLSKAFQKNIDDAIDKQNKALDITLFLIIPAAFALAVLSEEIIQVLFERGEFQHTSTLQTAKALKVFAVGLPSYVLFKVIVASFHANGDTKTPVKVAMFSLIINIAISYSLLDIYEHVSIAIGSVVSSYCTAMALVWILYKKQLFLWEMNYLRRATIYTFNSALMVYAISWLNMCIVYNIYIKLFLLIIFGLTVYIALAFITKLLNKKGLTY